MSNINIKDKNAVKNHLANPGALPEMCYATLPGNPRSVIIVKRGERGYWPYMVCDTADDARRVVICGNNNLVVTMEEAEALLILSMRPQKTIRDIKKGDFFTLSNLSHPKESQVWIRDEYDRSERKYTAHRFDDVNYFRSFKADFVVYTEFTF